MSKPAFLVDGNLEQIFVKNVCPGASVRLIGCNGDKVSSNAIAKRIASQYRILSKKNHPIIAVIDRESRDISAEELKNEIVKCLKKDENIDNGIIIGVADRMIENWILADKENISKYTNTDISKIPDFEGEYGKGKIKYFIPKYHETTIGSELLKKSNPQNMLSSKSFADFFKCLCGNLDCWWLKKGVQ